MQRIVRLLTVIHIAAQEARSEATATPAESLYEMEHANGRASAGGGEGRPSLASADSGGGGGIPRTRGPERGMLKSPSSGSLSALARGGEARILLTSPTA